MGNKLSTQKRIGVKLALIVGSISVTLISIVLSLSLAQAQSGTGTIRVSLTGNDVAGCGGVGNECRTVRFAANQATSGDTIVIAAGTFNETDSLLIVGKNVSFQGAGSAVSIINSTAPSGKSAIEFINTPNAAIESLTIQGGQAASHSGGGLRLYNSSVQVHDTVIQNNSADLGGGVYIDGGSALTLMNTVVQSNTAGTGGGGGIYLNNQSSTTIENSTIRDNTSHGNGGGGILNNQSSLTLSSVNIQNNTATSSGGTGYTAGGGFHVYNSSLIMQGNSEVKNNTASEGGGMYVNQNSRVSIRDSVLESNSATAVNPAVTGGGAIYLLKSAMTITNGTVQGNTAADAGGGIWVEEASLAVSDSTVQNNHANGRSGGGGLYTYGSILTMTNTIVQNNVGASIGTPYEGGGGLYVQSTKATLQNSVVRNNSTEARGGGFYLNKDGLGRAANLVLISTQVISNSAAAGGGVFINESCSANLDKVMIQKNLAASDAGGGIYLYKGTLTSQNAIVARNQSANQGGGIFSDNSFTMTLTHDTIAGNHSTLTNYGGVFCRNGGSAALRNLIIWDNDDDLASVNSSACTSPTHSIVQDGDNGSSTANPLFLDPAHGDFHITALSPAINQGANLGVLDDIDGQLRDALPDIGADEALVDLSITKIGQVHGTVVTYEMAFKNMGSLEATGVHIQDSVPLTLTNLNVIHSGAAITQTGAAPNYVWDVQNLKLDEGGVIIITGVYPDNGQFTNSASISGDKTESTLANNTSTATLISTAMVDLSITKTGQVQGTAVVYKIAFSNIGNLQATGVQVMDSLPPSLTSLNVIHSGAAITQTGAAPNYVWDAQNLKWGEGGTITITGVYSGDSAFANTATVSGDKAESSLSNNASTVMLVPNPKRVYVPLVLK